MRLRQAATAARPDVIVNCAAFNLVDAAEEQDLRRRVSELEKENVRLRMEREILKKAARYFAKESR